MRTEDFNTDRLPPHLQDVGEAFKAAADAVARTMTGAPSARAKVQGQRALALLFQARTLGLGAAQAQHQAAAAAQDPG